MMPRGSAVTPVLWNFVYIFRRVPPRKLRKRVPLGKLLERVPLEELFGTILREELLGQFLSRELSLESSIGRTFGDSSEGRTSGGNSVEESFERTVMSRELSLGDSSMERTYEEFFSSSSPSSSAFAAQYAEHADIRQEQATTMTIIILAQYPPAIATDSESGGGSSDEDSSDSLFFTRTSSSHLASSTSSNRLVPTTSSSLSATSSTKPFGSRMTSTNDEINQVKNQVEGEDETQHNEPEADFGNEEEEKGDKSMDNKQEVKSGDDNKEDKFVDDKPEVKSGDDKKEDKSGDDKQEIKPGDDKKEDKSVNDKEEDWSYHKGWNERGLSNAGKKRLNRQMRELVRPVHVSALAYTLPDKTKKCCMTWRAAISLHEETTGKRPNWSSHFLQCKLRGKFFTCERDFESHYTRQHVDMSIYNQTLRRLTQWDTTGVSESEVEWNISLIQNIGETLDLPKETVERDILQASRLPSLQGRTPSTNRPKDPALSGSGPRSSLPASSTMAPDTPTSKTPKLAALAEKGRSMMKGSLQTSDAKAGSKTKTLQTSDAKAGSKTKKVRKETSPVVNVDADEEEQEYEYYSSSSEPPPTKAKKGPASSSSKKTEELDVHGWKKRAVELEKLLHKVSKENRALKRQLSSERAKKSRKSRSLKQAVKSLLEAGSNSTSDRDDEKK